MAMDVAIVVAIGETHAAALRSDGVGAPATKYEKRKRNTYKDMKTMFWPFVLEAHGGFGNEAKKLVRELERRRKERECLPNTRITDNFQSLGEIDLVTAIEFELVRRNVRMILDRCPEEEPLIPAAKTRIRLEMARKKRKSEEFNWGGYEHDIPSDPELIGEDQTDRN